MENVKLNIKIQAFIELHTFVLLKYSILIYYKLCYHFKIYTTMGNNNFKNVLQITQLFTVRIFLKKYELFYDLYN